MSFAACSWVHGINKSTMHYIKKGEKEIKQIVANSNAPVSAKVSQYIHDSAVVKMEKLLVHGINTNCHYIPADTTNIRVKAKVFYEHSVHEYGMHSFVASKG